MEHATTFRLITALLLASGLAAADPWVHLGPGSGGSIQDIVCDPGTPGRLFYLSDVDGVYESRDLGASWRSLHQGVVMYHTRTVRVHPSNPAICYLGTWWGLQTSRDGGVTWNLPGDPASPTTAAYAMRNNIIGVIAVTPARPDRVWAAAGWGSKGNSLFATYALETQTPIGPREVFWSDDAGLTWQRSTYAAGESHRNVFDLVPDPISADTIWVAASGGLYRGVHTDAAVAWQRLAPPAGVDAAADGTTEGREVCFGADISPDGAWIYATFTHDLVSDSTERVPLSLPFAARTADLLATNDGSAWIPLADSAHRGELPVPDNDTAFGVGGTDTNVNYGRPRVDPRSTPTQHRVLLAHVNPVSGGTHGLMEGTFTVGAGVTGTWQRICARSGDPGLGGTFSYDAGWNPLTSRATGAAYTPTSWDATYGRQVIAIASQNAFIGRSEDYLTSWSNLGTTRISSSPAPGTYANRGVVCTVDYDVARHGDYLITAQADNGMAESLDGGTSWRGTTIGLGHGDACLVVPLDDPVVITSLVLGSFGGANQDAVATIYGKRLSGDGSFKAVAGGASGIAGWRRTVDGSNTNGMRPTRFAYAPTRPQRVAATHNYGIAICEDIGAIIDGAPATGDHFTFVVMAPNPNQGYRDVCFDPEDADQVHYIDNSRLVRLARQSTGAWTMAEQIPFTDPINFSMWRHAGHRYRLMTLGSQEVQLQIDEGPWQVILNRSAIDAVASAAGNAWYSQLLAHFASDTTKLPFTVTAVGAEDVIVAVSYQAAFRRGCGALLGRIAADGSVSWRDWTGDPADDHYLYKSHFRGLRLQREGGDLVFLGASSGAGSWMRVVTPVPTVQSSSSAQGQVGAAFVFDIVADGSPTSFSADVLPDGLVLDPASGRIAGTPLVAGSWSVSLQVEGAGGATTSALTITIAPAGMPSTDAHTTAGGGGGSGGGGGCGVGATGGFLLALLLLGSGVITRRVGHDHGRR